VDRVGTTGFVQLETESSKTLTLQEQTVAYEQLSPAFDAAGKVTAVKIAYPRDYVRQQLGYASMYGVQ
jgi:hypothetical protein